MLSICWRCALRVDPAGCGFDARPLACACLWRAVAFCLPIFLPSALACMVALCVPPFDTSRSLGFLLALGCKAFATGFGGCLALRFFARLSSCGAFLRLADGCGLHKVRLRYDRAAACRCFVDCRGFQVLRPAGCLWLWRPLLRRYACRLASFYLSSFLALPSWQAIVSDTIGASGANSIWHPSLGARALAPWGQI